MGRGRYAVPVAPGQGQAEVTALQGNPYYLHVGAERWSRVKPHNGASMGGERFSHHEIEEWLGGGGNMGHGPFPRGQLLRDVLPWLYEVLGSVE